MATILILDDRATNRSIYARLAGLVAEDVAVESFADPLDALEWLEHNPVDLVITDFKMPGMDGAEFTRRLRATPATAGVPVVVITAHADRGFRLRALDAGATDFLQSPIDHVEFVARARSLLTRGTAAVRDPAPLRADAEALARLLDALPAMVSVTDPEDRCIFVNALQARLAGAAGPEELEGADAARLHGSRAARSLAGDRRVLETGAELPPYAELLEQEGAPPRRLLTRKAPLRDAAGRLIGVITASVLLPEVMPTGVVEPEP
jgi:CheY-like chemotaxis protein